MVSFKKKKNLEFTLGIKEKRAVADVVMLCYNRNKSNSIVVVAFASFSLKNKKFPTFFFFLLVLFFVIFFIFFFVSFLFCSFFYYFILFQFWNLKRQCNKKNGRGKSSSVQHHAITSSRSKPVVFVTLFFTIIVVICIDIENSAARSRFFLFTVIASKKEELGCCGFVRLLQCWVSECIHTVAVLYWRYRKKMCSNDLRFHFVFFFLSLLLRSYRKKMKRLTILCVCVILPPLMSASVTDNK